MTFTRGREGGTRWIDITIRRTKFKSSQPVSAMSFFFGWVGTLLFSFSHALASMTVANTKTGFAPARPGWVGSMHVVVRGSRIVGPGLSLARLCCMKLHLVIQTRGVPS